MAKFHLTNKAVDDLNAIWDYTVQEWSQKQAERYYNLLMATCADLANNPQLGKLYDIISNDIIGYKCGEHIIFYREISKNEIEITRILHGMMDLKSKL